MSVHGPRCRFTNARSVTRSLRAEVTVAGGSGTVHSHGKIMETPAFWWHLLRTKMEILCDALLVYRKVFENEFMLCTIPWNYTLAIHMHAKNAISKAIVCQHAVRRGLSQYSFAAVGLVYLSTEEIKHVHGAQNAFAHFWNHLKGLCNHTWSTFCLVFVHTRSCSLLQVTRYKIIQKGVLFHNCPTLQATTPLNPLTFTGPLVPWGCHPDRCWECHQIRQVLVWQVLVSAVTSFQRVNTMVRSMESPVGSSWPVLNICNLPGRNFICFFEGWTWME